MRKEYVFNRVVDFHIAAIELARRDAKKGDLEAQQFLQQFSNLSVNRSNTRDERQQQQATTSKPSR